MQLNIFFSHVPQDRKLVSLSLISLDHKDNPENKCTYSNYCPAKSQDKGDDPPDVRNEAHDRLDYHEHDIKDKEPGRKEYGLHRVKAHVVVLFLNQKEDKSGDPPCQIT